jgi:hypothetical protein
MAKMTTAPLSHETLQQANFRVIHPQKPLPSSFNPERSERTQQLQYRQRSFRNNPKII